MVQIIWTPYLLKMEKNKKLIEFWDNCDPVFSHIEISGYLNNPIALAKSWENNFLKEYDFTDKTVIDYGIGGGFLGLYLFNFKGIKKYIGFDISERQLSEANKNLDGFPFELYNTLNRKGFKSYPADIFICQAVIQHFPNEEYLINFLTDLNKSDINDVMLQIRYNEKTVFNKSYDKTEDVRLACQTNSEYLLNYLTKYTLVKSKKLNNKSNYEFLFFKKI